MRPIAPLVIELTTSATNLRDDGHAGMCPTPQVITNLSGLWSGTLFLAGDEEGTPFSLRQGGGESSRGDPAGRLAFTGTQVAPAEVQLLEASATTYVALVGPYRDPASNTQMLTLLEARRAGDRLYGTCRVRPVTGGRATEGRFVAVRSDLAA